MPGESQKSLSRNSFKPLITHKFEARSSCIINGFWLSIGLLKTYRDEIFIAFCWTSILSIRRKSFESTCAINSTGSGKAIGHRFQDFYDFRCKKFVDLDSAFHSVDNCFWLISLLVCFSIGSTVSDCSLIYRRCLLSAVAQHRTPVNLRTTIKISASDMKKCIFVDRKSMKCEIKIEIN